MRLPRVGIRWPEVSEAYLAIDGLAAAAASVVVALLGRQWPDDEKRELEMENMRLQNEKVRAEIEVLRSVEVVAKEAEQQEPEPEPEPEPPKGRRRRG